MSLCSFLLFLLSTLLSRAYARDTITPSTPITDVTQTTIVSANGMFELGFFSPGNSKNRYLGIWYKSILPQTVVWVANRAKPITDSTGILNISTNGNLILLNATSTVFWSSPASANYTTNPIAQLLDSGNFILRESSTPAGFLWQSFDYPTDTLLAGMKLGVNLKTGLNRYLTSWETANNPYLGEYSLKMDLQGVPEIYIYRGTSKIYTGGPWNGLQFSGVPDLKSDGIFNFSFIIDTNEVYYTYEILNQSITSNLILNNNGKLDRRVWLGNEKGWQVFWSDPKTDCDDLAKCGPFGFCTNTDGSPICNCLFGFVPKSEQEWKFRDGSGGCLRRTKLDCKGDGFLLKHNMKLPVSINATMNTTMSLEDCREMCLKNCYCTAYANSNILGGGSGCFTWIGELINLQEFEDGGQDLYIRLAASEVVSGNTKEKISHKNRLVAILAPITSVLLLFGLVGFCFCIKKFKMVSLSPHTENDPILFLAKNVRMQDSANIQHLDSDQENGKDLELKLFEMATIMAATEGFAPANKLGQGGFGPVYKGTLREGQDIAVKRLSNDSSQGLDEFKNEVILIAKLQHRNLVRLLGCCIDGDERMLIYEFMPNRSLDTFIFDAAKRTILNWQRRFDIISGIARGLLYLHQDSRLRIIHRDIKSSNVLLDADMNPKISDFGIARIFGGNETDAYTGRVVGTYGYMAPEYAADGVFSVKSDVFSFGVLVLEIVSGKKNKGFYQLEPHLNLLRHTWRLWNEGKILELVDESLDGSYISFEVLRCIQVGLLCVQERAIDRPLMSSVTMMLGSETMMLPEPNEPGFVSTKISIDTKSSSGYTMNDVTMTRIDAR